MLIIFIWFLLFVCVFSAFITGSGVCYTVIKTCVFGSEAKAGLLDDVPVLPRNEGDSGSSVKQAIKLIFCAAGLQVGILPVYIVPAYAEGILCNPFTNTLLVHWLNSVFHEPFEGAIFLLG